MERITLYTILRTNRICLQIQLLLKHLVCSFFLFCKFNFLWSAFPRTHYLFISCVGPYFKTDGTELCSSLVAHVSHKISCILEDCEDFVNSSENYPPSVGQYLNNQFEKYLDECLEDEIAEKNIKWDLLHWHFK